MAHDRAPGYRLRKAVMETWPDWRYRLVAAIDKLWHVFAGTHEIPLCNLERRMWWRRYDVMYPETAFRRAT